MNGGFTLQSEAFQGPLETLLDLIESRKLSISDIALSEMCDAYLAYVESLPKLPIAETSQFILVASTLLLIKSRTLLPELVLSTDEEHDIKELERRLAHYARIRATARLLRGRQERSLPLPKRAPDLALRDAIVQFAPGEASRETLVAALRRMLTTLPTFRSMVEASVAPVIALEEVIENLRQRLTRSFRTKWSELTKAANKQDLIVHFLAVLELVRSGSVSVSQERLFSDMIIESDELGAPRYG